MGEERRGDMLHAVVAGRRPPHPQSGSPHGGSALGRPRDTASEGPGCH